ncbi:MAG TPA: hydrogenase, partial [Chitinophagales bacterium]|nr:hydrogenase [Chitinophagales bacterium]
MFVSPLREPLIQGHKTYKQISDDICAPVEAKPSKAWFIATTLSGLLAINGFVMIGLTITYGIGMWGLNKTVGWAWDITNFVWWIGIGHAGTLISAILFLFRQRWRTAVNRAAEAMTIFAVM